MSLDEFSELIRKIDPDRSSTDVVRVFREATSSSDRRDGPSTGEATITLDQFMDICRKHGLVTAVIQGDLRVPNCFDQRKMGVVHLFILGSCRVLTLRLSLSPGGETTFLGESWELLESALRPIMEEIRKSLRFVLLCSYRGSMS